MPKVVPSTQLTVSATASDVNQAHTDVEMMGTYGSPLESMVAAANLGNDGDVSRHERHIRDDDRRFHRTLDLEEAGLRKPSVNERLVAARTRAFETGNIEGVHVAEGRIAKRQAVRQRARVRRKNRKRELREYCRTLEYNNRIPDPRSDDEGAGVA